MRKWFLLACIMAFVWMFCQVWVAWSAVKYNLAETIFMDRVNRPERFIPPTTLDDDIFKPHLEN